MLEAGDRLPDTKVWTASSEGAVPLADALMGDGYALLCFYAFDWSGG